jgi:CHAD domain-containing protein
MTTDRTPIRRWLAIGGRSHRPPWGAGKSRHAAILAPLAATLAASAAVGLGFALVRGNGQRRAGGKRRGGGRITSRPLGLLRGERLDAGLRRMTLEQTDVVLAALSRLEGHEEDPKRSVHEARKAIKRLRTIVRLLEGELGRGFGKREQQALRSVAATLAGARDAEVMLVTLERVVRRDPRKLAGTAGLTSLRLALARERTAADRTLLDSPVELKRAIEELRRFRSRAIEWPLARRKKKQQQLDLVAPGLRKIYGSGGRRMRRAATKRGGRTRTMHQWRKRVKDLRYVAEALGPVDRKQCSSRSARAEARWLHRLGREADELGEVLGEEHDLAVLGEWIELHGAATGAERKTRKLLLKRIERRRRKLRRRALRDGRELYRRKPRKLVRRAEKAIRRGTAASVN